MEDFKNCKPMVSVDARLSVRQGRWSLPRNPFGMLLIPAVLWPRCF